MGSRPRVIRAVIMEGSEDVIRLPTPATTPGTTTTGEKHAAGAQEGRMEEPVQAQRVEHAARCPPPRSASAPPARPSGLRYGPRSLSSVLSVAPRDQRERLVRQWLPWRQRVPWA